MGLAVGEIVKRTSEKARDDKRVGVVFGTCESVGILCHGAEDYLIRTLAKKLEMGEAIIGLISYLPGEPEEPEIEFFGEYADDPTAVSWIECCAATIRKNAGR
jgi:hypothetical protein